jgi:hypothetical protein
VEEPHGRDQGRAIRIDGAEDDDVPGGQVLLDARVVEGRLCRDDRDQGRGDRRLRALELASLRRHFTRAGGPPSRTGSLLETAQTAFQYV